MHCVCATTNLTYKLFSINSTDNGALKSELCSDKRAFWIAEMTRLLTDNETTEWQWRYYQLNNIQATCCSEWQNYQRRAEKLRATNERTPKCGNNTVLVR